MNLAVVCGCRILSPYFNEPEKPDRKLKQSKGAAFFQYKKCKIINGNISQNMSEAVIPQRNYFQNVDLLTIDKLPF